MAVITAERFTALKAKVKAEMLRRSQSGSVAAYGGTAYDYITAPSAGKVIQKEHIEKLTGPMRAVNPDLVPEPDGIVTETELANLETRITAWAQRGITDRTATDCKSGCTGTCYTGCATGCSGTCGDACTGGCKYGCSDDCGSGCGNCNSGCYGGCQGQCGDGTCRSTCTGYCGRACATQTIG